MSGKPPLAPPSQGLFPKTKVNEARLTTSIAVARDARQTALKDAREIEALNKQISMAAPGNPSIQQTSAQLREASSERREQAAAAQERIAELEDRLARSPVQPTALTRRGVAGLFPPVNVKKPMEGRGKTRRNTSTGGSIVTQMLTIRNQVKLYHWQTGSFARHKATDDLVGTLDTLIDSFVETYMGKYGRPKVSGTIKLHNFSESAAKSFVAQQRSYLSSVLPRKLSKADTDLLNLRDEILGELNKVLYLFTLA